MKSVRPPPVYEMISQKIFDLTNDGFPNASILKLSAFNTCKDFLSEAASLSLLAFSSHIMLKQPCTQRRSCLNIKKVFTKAMTFLVKGFFWSPPSHNCSRTGLRHLALLLFTGFQFFPTRVNNRPLLGPFLLG